MILAETPIRKQEPLIVERMRLAFPKDKFSIERIPVALSLNEFQRITARAPFIGLAFVATQPETTNGRQFSGKNQWRLTLISKASNGLEARFKGDRHDIGLDAMLDVAMVLMQGVTFDGEGYTNVTAANAVTIDNFDNDNIALAQLDFTFSFSRAVSSLKLISPDDFKELAITWSVTGGDNHLSGTIATDPSELSQ